MNEVISNSKDVSFTVVDQNNAVSDKITFGHAGLGSKAPLPGKHAIDVADAAVFGNGLITTQGVLAHEIKEGFEMQTDPSPISQAKLDAAHEKAITVENKVNGSQRIGGLITEERRFFMYAIPNPKGKEATVPRRIEVNIVNDKMISTRGNNR